jgi:hypothetical protein
MPPLLIGVLRQAVWVNCESMEIATTAVLRCLNSSIRLLRAINSEGQTNVKSKG